MFLLFYCLSHISDRININGSYQQIQKVITKKEKIGKNFKIPCSLFLIAKKLNNILMMEKRMPIINVIST